MPFRAYNNIIYGCKVTNNIWINKKSRRKLLLFYFLLTMMFAWNGEWLATLLATSGKNAAAISGLHTQTEAVLVDPLSVVRLESSFHCLILFFIVNSIQFYHPDAATSAENDCKISDFREIGKRKNQKTLTFFAFLMIFRTFAPDFNKFRNKY